MLHLEGRVEVGGRRSGFLCMVTVLDVLSVTCIVVVLLVIFYSVACNFQKGAWTEPHAKTPDVQQAGDGDGDGNAER
jgi:hypothetical protein